MLENAILDLTPEDAMEMNKKKRLLRWDAKKKKFVKVSTCISIVSKLIYIVSLSPANLGGDGKQQL